MANRFLLALIVLLLVLQDSLQRTTKCGNIDCVVEANGCKQNSEGIQVCECFVGRKGDACEIDRDECTEHNGRSPCGHRGYCVNSVGSYRCDCLEGWSGMTCRSQTHPPSFDCFPGWTGRFCSYDIDECSSGITQCPGPHEYCTNTDGGFNCTCDAGWEGPHCIQDIDECADNPCGMNEMCQNTIGSFECPCMIGWYGVNCTQNIDECVLKPCGTSGKCVDTNGSFVCECLSGYTGDMCESTIPDNSMSPTTYAVIGCLAGFAFIILIIVILVYCYMRSKLKDLRESQEEARRLKTIQDRTKRIQPFAPMFAIKQQMDPKAVNTTQYRNKHTTDTKQRYEGHIHAVQPLDINRDNSRHKRHHISTHSRDQTARDDLHAENKWNNTRRPTKHFNTPTDNFFNGRSSDSSSSLTQNHYSPIGVNTIRVTSDSPIQQKVPDEYEADLLTNTKWNDNKQMPSYRSQIGIRPSRASSNSLQTQVAPAYYGKGLESDYKWESSRHTRNYTISSDTTRSRMSSDSSLQQIIPVHYEEDPVYNN